MPQLALFGRNWSIGSDDFVFPGIADCFLRVAWFIVVLVMYVIYNDEIGDNCQDAHYLHVYFIGLFVFLLLTSILSIVIVRISMRGTIADSNARRQLPVVLYIRLAVGLPEVSWNGYGTYCAFETAENCHKAIVNIAKGTVIFGWIVLLFCIIIWVIIFNLYSGKSKNKRTSVRVRSFRRGSRRVQMTTKQWEKRCKCMFMCARGDDTNTSVFSVLAELSADYFKGVNLVPTDVVAGLILLSRKQERKRQRFRTYVKEGQDESRYSLVREEEVIETTDIICDYLPTPKDWMTLDLMSHYLKFAIGSYGWPFYVTLVKPVLGLCALCTECRCCSCKDDQGSVFMDNCCMCNTAAFKKTTKIHHDDIVYACFKNDIYELPFYVVIDREKNAVVVAVRGTLSLQDVITDLVIERGDITIPGIPGASAHNGILQSAIYIKQTLERENVLEEAFQRAEGANLVITGHSLGAGAAALLAILLKPSYPNLRCYAFSPPGELVSPDVSSYAEDIVCSVVLGDDIISRQGMLMMDDLKINIITAIYETRLPKYKIIAGGFWRMCCGRSGMLDETIEYGVDTNDGSNGKNSNGDTVDARDAVVFNRCSLEVSLAECTLHSQTIKNTYQPLHMPGQIVHIDQSHSSGDDEFIASWKRPENFTEIIVSPDMLAHHFPDALLEAIDDIREKDPVIRTINPNEKKDIRLVIENES
ncbi:hypothetical protein ACF0H5_000206 [Mactra antiquata]